VDVEWESRRRSSSLGVPKRAASRDRGLRGRLGARRTLGAALWVLGARAVAAGCPDCYEGRAARARAFGSSFLGNLAAVAAPFAMTAVISLWAGRARRERDERGTPP
jgi:hypothetical protein